MSHLLALDAGTTNVRALLFDGECRVVAEAQREIRQHYPRPGWVEHDPREIWEAQAAVTEEAMARAGIGRGEVAALGITNQRETVLLWDRTTGEPLGNAIVWQDRRTAAACERLRAEGREPEISRRTGLLLDPYFSATKVAWMLEHFPGARERAQAGELACGTIDAWLVWKLTGEERRHLTDVSNASRTLLYNLETREWDPELLAWLGIPAGLLPEVRSSSEVYGVVSGLPVLAGVPVAGIAGDQQAALFGQACVSPGMAKCTYGTGCFLLQNIGQRPVASRQRLLTTAAWQIGERFDYALEGSVFMGGAVFQWLRDGLGIVKTSWEVDELAATVPDSGGVVLVPAFAGLGAPHWDPYARGALLGLTRDTTAAHLARAALEGVAFQVADLLEAMQRDTGTPLPELRVDGGASQSEPLMQFQADLLGVSVVASQSRETTALGAAMLAGLAVGFWKGLDEVTRGWKAARRYEPQMGRSEAEARRARWKKAVERARGWEEPDREGAK